MTRVLAAVLAAFALAGCARTEVPSAEEQIRAAATAFIADCARDDLAAAADILSEAVQEPFIRAGQSGCAGVLGADPAAARAGAISDLRSEQFATVAIDGGNSIELERRGELWYITTSPPPTPPGR